MPYNTSMLMTLCPPASRSPGIAENQFAASLLNGEEPPPRNSRTDKQLTAPADRPVRDPAHAVAFTAAVAVGGAGSVPRRTGMRTAAPFPATATVPDPRRRLTAGKTHPRRCRPFRLAAAQTTATRGGVTQILT